MRAVLGILGLLIVLGIVAVNVRNELHATKSLMPSSAGASSAPFGGSSSPSAAQFQQELDRTMHQAATQHDAAMSDAESR